MTKKEKKSRNKNLTDEEKEALKAKKAEKKAKYESLTDEEKEALKAEREAKKTEKKAEFENLTDEEKEAKYQELEAQMCSLTKNALAEMGDVTKDVKGLEDNKQVQMPEEN